MAAAVPGFVGIEITRRCNLRCPHCFTDSGADAHPGPTSEQAESMLARLARAGVTRIGFSGGEPLLRDDLEDLMRRGRAAGIEGYGLVTNGWFVTRDRARALVRAGLKTVQVSLDGVDAADHDRVRGCGPDGYYRAVRAIRIFRDVGLPVDVATLLGPRNLERLPELALLCEALGVHKLRWCTFVPTGRAKRRELRAAYDIEPERLDAFLQLLRAMDAAPDAPLRVGIDHGIGPWDEAGRFRCRSGRSVAYIDAEGELYPCPALLFPAFRVGNVHREPLDELLRRPAMHRVRRLSRRESRGPCGTCAHPGCTGGCRGLSYAVAGDGLESPPYCNVLRRVGG